MTPLEVIERADWMHRFDEWCQSTEYMRMTTRPMDAGEQMAQRHAHALLAEAADALRAAQETPAIKSASDVRFMLGESAGPREKPTQEMADAIWALMKDASPLVLAVRCWERGQAVTELRAVTGALVAFQQDYQRKAYDIALGNAHWASRLAAIVDTAIKQLSAR